MYLERAIEWFNHLAIRKSHSRLRLAVFCIRDGPAQVMAQLVSQWLFPSFRQARTGPQDRAGCMVGWSCRGCSSDPWMQHGIWHTVYWNPKPSFNYTSRPSAWLFLRDTSRWEGLISLFHLQEDELATFPGFWPGRLEVWTDWTDCGMARRQYKCHTSTLMPATLATLAALLLAAGLEAGGEIKGSGRLEKTLDKLAKQ